MIPLSLSASFMLEPFPSLSLSDGPHFFQRSHLSQKACPSKLPQSSLQQPPFRLAIPNFSNDNVSFVLFFCFFALLCPLFAQLCFLIFKQLTINCYGRLESPISSHLWPSKTAHPQGGQKNNNKKIKMKPLRLRGVYTYTHI